MDINSCIIRFVFSISDPTLTTDGVADVMESINDWSSLKFQTLYVSPLEVVPANQLSEIQKRCSTKREIANECASYYVHYHPQPSWTHLASHLYQFEEFAAVQTSKPFLPLRDKYQVISLCVS